VSRAALPRKANVTGVSSNNLFSGTPKYSYTMSYGTCTSGIPWMVITTAPC
jgi:hypothetical protein